MTIHAGGDRLASSREGPALRLRVKAAVALGNGFEFYDFSVFGFFAVPIGRTFFPTAGPRMSLLLSVGTFGVGYLARPAGALAIGHHADRHGRKPAMLATMLLMAFATLGIAVLPGYASWGVASPMLVVAMRLVQGFALGGETGSAVALCLVADAVPSTSRATGLSVAYALGISLFGSATQPAAVALLAWTGDPRSTAWLLVGAGLTGTAAALALPRPGPSRMGCIVPRRPASLPLEVGPGSAVEPPQPGSGVADLLDR